MIRELVPQPDVRRTLQEAGNIADGFAKQVASLPTISVEEIDRRFDGGLFEQGHYGQMLDSQVSVLAEEFADCASIVAAANDIEMANADINKLKSMSAEAIGIATKLGQLPMSAAWAIILIEQALERPTFSVIDGSCSARFVWALKHLARLSWIAADVQTAERGLQSDTPQFLAVQSLAHLFNSATYDNFYFQRHLLNRPTFKRYRESAFSAWNEAWVSG